MLAMKNSQNLRLDSSERRKIAGTLPAGAPTAASYRPEIGVGL
jgi:hypothetical protein